MKRFFLSLNTKQRAAIIAVLIVVLNFLALPVFGIASVDFENGYVPVYGFILSLVLYLIHIPFTIIMRKCRRTEILLGIFFYQLVGIVCYIIFFAGFIAGQGASNGLTAFYSVFAWWSSGYSNMFVMLSRFTGIPLKFTGAILYMILSYITAMSYASTKKDIRFEADRKAEKEYIEKTKGRHSA